MSNDLIKAYDIMLDCYDLIKGEFNKTVDSEIKRSVDLAAIIVDKEMSSDLVTDRLSDVASALIVADELLSILYNAKEKKCNCGKPIESCCSGGSGDCSGGCSCDVEDKIDDEYLRDTLSLSSAREDLTDWDGSTVSILKTDEHQGKGDFEFAIMANNIEEDAYWITTKKTHEQAVEFCNEFGLNIVDDQD